VADPYSGKSLIKRREDNSGEPVRPTPARKRRPRILIVPFPSPPQKLQGKVPQTALAIVSCWGMRIREWSPTAAFNSDRSFYVLAYAGGRSRLRPI